MTELVTTPMAHQRAAFDKMRPSRVGALFMEMGTGKSLVVMMLALARREKISKIVWCCPVSLKRNTRRQILEHTTADDDDVFMFGDQVTDATLPDANWYIVGLESIGGSDRVVMALNEIVDKNTKLVVDESSYIKGHRAKRTRRLHLIGKRARYRLILNGTPLIQGIEDLYAQMMFLDERILGYRSWYSFQRAHINWSERYKGMINARVGQDKLTRKMAPYVYQVTKDECMDLPDKLVPAARYVDLTNAQKAYYKETKALFEYEAMMLDEEDDSGMGILVYWLFGALQSIANGMVPTGYEEHGQAIECNKYPELVQTLRQIDSGHVVVWCRYQINIDQAQAHLSDAFPDWTVYPYSGLTSEKRRDDYLQTWYKHGGIFLATAATGGYGLNELVAAKDAVFLSNSFKYSERLQAEDRLHRPGQVSPVSYTDIWADCGIENRIEKALINKSNALDDFRKEMNAARSQGHGAVHNAVVAL